MQLLYSIHSEIANRDGDNIITKGLYVVGTDIKAANFKVFYYGDASDENDCVNFYIYDNKDNYDNYVNNKKILIIDDNNSSIKLISKILDKHNILYDSSNLGKEALDRIRKGDKYDLILLDEDMPYMNGISVMNKFSKIKGFDTKVILLTKNSNIIYDDIYKDSGFSDYIIKPIDKDDLMNKINKYLK